LPGEETPVGTLCFPPLGVVSKNAGFVRVHFDRYRSEPSVTKNSQRPLPLPFSKSPFRGEPVAGREPPGLPRIGRALYVLAEGNEMTLLVEIEEESDGRWIAEIPDLPGVMTYGTSANDARATVQALALRVLADRLEHGEASPDLLSISFKDA
jgi:predicted RNase H-like HicB family nuclease